MLKVIDLLQITLLSTTVLFVFSASNSKWQLSEQNNTYEYILFIGNSHIQLWYALGSQLEYKVSILWLPLTPVVADNNML